MAEVSNRPEWVGPFFARAVRRERNAIGGHERAAAIHEASAVVLDDAALTAVDLAHAAKLRGRATAERDLAGVRRSQAAGVHVRLASGGTDVGQGCPDMARNVREASTR